LRHPATDDRTHHLRRRFPFGVRCWLQFGAIACAAALLAVACKSSSSTSASPSGSCSSSAPGGKLGGDCNTGTPALKLTGAGANSIQPFYERAFYYYNQANKGVSVDYSPVGGSVGKAARNLGLSNRFVLYRLMKKHGVEGGQ